MYKLTHVEGKDCGKIILYALSTCIWCRKTKKLLDKLQIAYDYVDVDQLNEEESSQAEKDIEKWNPKINFPTLVVDDARCIVGFNENEINKLKK
jgi:glutaredoxin-like protein NrdH